MGDGTRDGWLTEYLFFAIFSFSFFFSFSSSSSFPPPLFSLSSSPSTLLPHSTLALLVHPILDRTLPCITSLLSLPPLNQQRKRKLTHYFSSVTSTHQLPFLGCFQKNLFLSRIDRYPFPSFPCLLHFTLCFYLHPDRNNASIILPANHILPILLSTSTSTR